MSYQELEYLREELNQRLNIHLEHGSKTINIILITWGGVVVVLGTFGTKFMYKCSESAVLCFIGATIFFISNVILHSLARKYYDEANAIFRIGAYIQVFYDKRPSKTVTVGENTCWECVNFEITVRDITKNGGHRNRFYKRNDEYEILNFISLVFILFLSMGLFAIGSTISYILLAICVFYFIYSMYLFFSVSKHTSSKDNFGMRVKHLNDYFQYAINTGYYTEAEIVNRFGDIYDYCKEYSPKSNNSCGFATRVVKLVKAILLR